MQGPAAAMAMAIATTTTTTTTTTTYVQELAESCVSLPLEYVSRRRAAAEEEEDPSHGHDGDGELPVLDMWAYDHHADDEATSSSSCCSQRRRRRRSRSRSRSRSRKGGFVGDLRHACSAWGAFQLVNHGIPEDVVGRMRHAQRLFFGLPPHVKLAYANDVSAGRYEGYGSLLGAQRHGAAPRDWRDYLYLTILPHPSHPPSHPPSFRETIEEFSHEVIHVWRRLMRALGESLGISSLEQTFGELDMSLAMNYYPVCPQPDLTLGLSSHSDVGGITILLQDENVPGLQVKTPIDTWMTVQPIKNALLINLGDQLEILTNGLYKSAEHRVLVNSVSPRLSLGCFMSPSNDVVVAPLQELVGDENPPNYEPMTFKQYRSMIRRTGINGKSYLKSRAA